MTRATPLTLPGVLLLGACAASLPPVPMAEFTAGDLETVRAFYEEQAYHGDEASLAMWLNGLAQVELLMGRTEDAWRHFRTAGAVMGNWQTPGSETFAAVVGSESSKTWKGDPYEKAMNAYYTGLLFLWHGEPDNARASFLRGILADAESGGDEEYRADFTLLYWLAGRMSLRMGRRQDAEDHFREARDAQEFAVLHGSRGSVGCKELTDPAAGNLVCLVDVGLGPEKFADGSHRELARFRPRSHPAQRAEIFLDGQSLGTTCVLADLFYQANTRGGTQMEGIREGKAVLKTTTTVGGVVLLHEGLRDHGSGQRDKLVAGGALLLLSLLVDPSADVRHWAILPETVQVLAADVAPGEHELRIEFLDAWNRRIDHLGQTATVDVPEEGESYYIFRSLPGLDRRETTP